jgi:hypothetical protein
MKIGLTGLKQELLSLGLGLGLNICIRLGAIDM